MVLTLICRYRLLPDLKEWWASTNWQNLVAGFLHCCQEYSSWLLVVHFAVDVYWVGTDLKPEPNSTLDFGWFKVRKLCLPTFPFRTPELAPVQAQEFTATGYRQHLSEETCTWHFLAMWACCWQCWTSSGRDVLTSLLGNATLGTRPKLAWGWFKGCIAQKPNPEPWFCSLYQSLMFIIYLKYLYAILLPLRRPTRHI